MILDLVKIGANLLDKVIPDPKEREKAKIELMKQQQAGHFRELEISMSAIIEESKSEDPWTSRGRPTFLYVMYAIILWCIPMGILFAYNPEVANDLITGSTTWLNSIPQEMWTLFGVGYLGYTGASRS